MHNIVYDIVGHIDILRHSIRSDLRNLKLARIHAALFHYMICHGHVITCNYMKLHDVLVHYMHIISACNTCYYMKILHDYYMPIIMLMAHKKRFEYQFCPDMVY